MNTLTLCKAPYAAAFLAVFAAFAMLISFTTSGRAQTPEKIVREARPAFHNPEGIAGPERNGRAHASSPSAVATGPVLYIDDSAGVLGTVDVQTGQTTVIGATGVILTDIAFAPDGSLYGLSFTDLYQINPITAEATFIGSHGIAEGNALVFDTRGILYAAGAGDTLLYTINPLTGAAQAIGDTGFFSAGDLAFRNGILFMSSSSNELISISPVNYQGTPVGPIGFSSVFGIATGDDGILYGVADTQVLSLNTVTGAGTLITDYQGAGLGPAFGSSFFSESTASQLVNISTRLKVQTGDNVLIGGFIIDGTLAKDVLVRGVGPSLADFGVNGVLADPVLELHEPNGLVITNNNWKDSQQGEIEVTGLAPTNNLEAAIRVTLAPGLYTAILRGNNNGAGVGLVEAFDLGSGPESSFANISTRGRVETLENVMIGGFFVGGTGSAAPTLVIRGIGPSLGAVGVAGALQDPTLELHSSDGDLLASNNDWQDTQQTEIEAAHLEPSDARESAIEATLGPGSYTVIVQGANNTIGVGLVEVYNLQ